MSKPSFPVELSLRDYFAAAALQGLISGFGARLSRDPKEKSHSETAALAAYEMADAMLAEREKP